MGRAEKPHDADTASTHNTVDGKTTARIIIQAGHIDTVRLHDSPEGRPGLLVIGEIPREPASFQPREGLRRQLDTALDSAEHIAVVCAVTGARGVGKTHLAAAFARRCIADGWPLVAWIVAEEAGQLLSGLAELAVAAGLCGHEDDSVTAARKARHWLETSAPDRSLIVFDNASDPDELTHWLPATGRARIIVTSTQRSFEDLGALIDVSIFSYREALTFLRHRTSIDDAAGAWELAKEVGCLPLALGQAAALVRRQRISYSTCIARLRAFPLQRYLTRQPGDRYPRGAAQAVLMSLQSVEDEASLARPLSDLLSVLSPAGVQRDLLRSTMGKVNVADLDETLGRLAEASLVTFSADDQSLIMHRFTQRVVRDRLAHDGLLLNTLSAAGTALKGMEVSPGDSWRERKVADHLTQQIGSVWDNSMPNLTTELGKEQVALVEALTGARYWSARHLRETGDVARAIHIGMVTLDAAEDLLDQGHTLTSIIRNELAISCRKAGRLSDSIGLLEQNLTDRDRTLGPAHPQTLNSREYLANAYREEGHLERAIELLERNLADRERTLGLDHFDTQTSRNDLALALQEAGRLDRATILFESNLAAREEALGPDHRQTLLSCGNLGSAYKAAGHLTAAIVLHRRVLASRERTLGTDHPATLTARVSLAGTYLAADRIPEAVALLEGAVSDRERLLGRNHPLSISGRDRLGTTYRVAGRLDQATDFLEGAVADRERVLGSHHPKTLRSRINLAVTYAAAGRRAEAAELLGDTIADCVRVLSDHHPITLRAQAHLDELTGH